MKITILYSAVLLILFFMSQCTSDKADLIVYNGKIYTVDNSFSIAEAIAIKDGKILAVGKNMDIMDKYQADQEIDLHGNCVYPGLIDAHCHFFEYGLSLQNADLTGTKSFDDVLKILQEHSRKFPSEWLIGRGWDQNDWEIKEFPSNEKLDELFPGKPVIITRIDGHAALASSEALKRAGVYRDMQINGGTIMTRRGKLTGILVDNAIDLVRRIIPQPDKEHKMQGLLKAQENCFAVGLTSVHDAGLGYDELHLIDSLQKAGLLKMRIYGMLAPGERNFEEYMYKGIYKTDHLNVRSIKLYSDGALGSRGALLLEPYTDDPHNYGLLTTDMTDLANDCRLAYKFGYQVNTHCIGDSANRIMLKIYGEILKGANDRRWRIEHAQVVNADDFRLFGQYSIIPSVQPTHATSDMYWANDRLGEDRLKGAYAYKYLLEQNGWLADGSDFPVESINPIRGFYAAVSRQDTDGFPAGGFMPEQKLTREEALKAMTIWAAKAAFEEKEKGSIEPGKFADFIVAEKDLMTIPVKEIPGIKIKLTFSGGQQVFPATKL
jgi:predicted amidohydrolase YtcJ